MMSQNDLAWESLFKEYEILSRINAAGEYIISASQIKKYREPRLMAKFDHSINLPRIFAENNLTILPISRGDYVISHFSAYQPFDVLDGSVAKASLPKNLQSLDPNNISSETIAINCALASGILSDFLNEDLLFPTVAGRMGSGQFDFTIYNTRTKGVSNVHVNNSQIEIDAALEGVHSLSLLEAKRDLSDDFLVRQLYYPYRVWHSRVTKKVRPIFLVYSNGVFSLYEYAFQDPSSYDSLVLVKQKNYSIEDTMIELSDLQNVASHTQIVREPSISFPQANRFERVINLCELLSSQPLSREQVTEKYAFDIRQTNYYTDAARYLGVVEKHYEEGRKPIYALSEWGNRIMCLPFKKRQLAFCEAILQHRPFKLTFERCMEKGAVPETEEIVKIMQESELYKVESTNTYARRASTISGWINWMLGIVEC